MVIHVTQKHIDDGDPSDCYRCPIALALRETPGLSECSAGKLGLYGVYDTRPFSIGSPRSVRRFIDAFDNGTDVLEPFTFELPL